MPSLFCTAFADYTRAVVASAMRLVFAERFISVDRQGDKTCKYEISMMYSCLPAKTCGIDLLADVLVWTCIEPSLGIVCACLPLLHPFFKRHSPEKVVGAHSSGYASVQTNNPASVHRNAKDFEDYSARVAHFHENVID